MCTDLKHDISMLKHVTKRALPESYVCEFEAFDGILDHIQGTHFATKWADGICLSVPQVEFKPVAFRLPVVCSTK